MKIMLTVVQLRNAGLIPSCNSYGLQAAVLLLFLSLKWHLGDGCFGYILKSTFITFSSFCVWSL